MSLATRCSECGTMFRVVQDQLRVSEGWVRCGRCDTVFNALDALVDLEAEAAALQAPPADRAPSDDPFYADASAAETDFEDGPHRMPAEAPAALPARAIDDNDEDHPAPPPAAPWARADEPAGWQVDVDPGPAAALPEDVSPAPATTAALVQPAAFDPAPADAAPLPGAPSPTPGFVRRAERDARWSSPAMRAALIGTALILTGLLGVQMLYHFRDAAAARSAVADRVLRSACARWGCKLEAPRRIQDVTLEGSGLARVPQQPQAVKLTINLRNRGDTDLMLPSVDLSLNDAKGELIARRTLGPADFRIDPPRIRRGAELPLELVLSTGERSIAGYTVELFYP